MSGAGCVGPRALTRRAIPGRRAFPLGGEYSLSQADEVFCSKSA